MLRPSTVITQLLENSRLDPALLAELEKLRRNVAVLFTDIKGSTEYFEKYGDVAGLFMVHRCNKLLSSIVEEHHGTVVKMIGDSVMAVFENCVSAVSASVKMQKELARSNESEPSHNRMYVRIGINYGLGIVRSNDVFGDVVNTASRVESVAEPEHILISASVKEMLGSEAFELRPIGCFALKGKEGDQDLFEVIWNNLRAPQSCQSHTIIARSDLFANRTTRFSLRHIHADGSSGAPVEIPVTGLIVGRTEGQMTFRGDSSMSKAHARFTIERGQLFVEDISKGTGVFVRLASTYMLDDGDVVLLGGQLLSFRENSNALTAAAATGTSISQMSTLLDEPLAEFISMGPQQGLGVPRYPIREQQVTFGRKIGTYVFSDDRAMSSRQARVYQRGENHFLEDLGSRNGTFVKVRGKAPVPSPSVVKLAGQILQVNDR